MHQFFEIVRPNKSCASRWRRGSRRLCRPSVASAVMSPEMLEQSLLTRQAGARDAV